MTYLLVFAGGGLGAVSRLALSTWVGRFATTSFPWGTLTVNLLGALAIGFLVELAALKFNMPQNLRYFLVTGILGGFTTFSAFTLETSAMLQRGDYANMLLYVLLSVFGSVLLFLLATHTVRQFI